MRYVHALVLKTVKYLNKTTKLNALCTRSCVGSKIEKVPRGIRGEKSSKDMASSRNLVSTIGALASPKLKYLNKMTKLDALCTRSWVGNCKIFK